MNIYDMPLLFKIGPWHTASELINSESQVSQYYETIPCSNIVYR